MTRYVALLRAVNLGPNRRVSMADLRGLLAERGYADVRTHLQSGNVVLGATETADALEAQLERQMAEALGVETRILVRTHEQLAGVVAANPLADAAAGNPGRLHVSFLSAEPDADVARELAAIDVAPERVELRGREVYLWLPEGVQRSRAMRAVAERRLGVTATTRNWNTVTRLLELVGG